MFARCRLVTEVQLTSMLIAHRFTRGLARFTRSIYAFIRRVNGNQRTPTRRMRSILRPNLRHRLCLFCRLYAMSLWSIKTAFDACRISWQLYFVFEQTIILCYDSTGHDQLPVRGEPTSGQILEQTRTRKHDNNLHRKRMKSNGKNNKLSREFFRY